MIDWIEALILGLVQGATEYLPVSSSGHLVIAQHLFGLREPALLFDIVLHLATLLAVLWYYRRDVWEIARQSLAGGGRLLSGGGWKTALSDFPAFRLGLLIALGTLPTAVIGLVDYRHHPEYVQGKAQAIWAIVLSMVIFVSALVGAVVAIISQYRSSAAAPSSILEAPWDT